MEGLPPQRVQNNGVVVTARSVNILASIRRLTELGNLGNFTMS